MRIGKATDPLEIKENSVEGRRLDEILTYHLIEQSLLRADVFDPFIRDRA